LLVISKSAGVPARIARPSR